MFCYLSLENTNVMTYTEKIMSEESQQFKEPILQQAITRTVL